MNLMRTLQDPWKAITVWIYFLLFISDTEGFDCYTCSYTLSGDPSLHYECVNAPWNFTLGSPVQTCALDSYCVSKVVYQKDKKTILSADRACRSPEIIGCGINCCDENSHNFVCQYQCRGSSGVCNVKDLSDVFPVSSGTETKASIVLFSVLLVSFLYMY